MPHEEDDPFEDENRPPLPELGDESGHDYQRHDGESDEDYGQRFREFLGNKTASPEPPKPYFGDMAGSAPPGQSQGAWADQSQNIWPEILEEVRRVREILEELLP